MVSPTTDRRIGLLGSTGFKAPVTVLAAGNITQYGEQTIDGKAVLAVNADGVPDRVACVGQTDATLNGIWDVSTTAWTRSLDANQNYDLKKGTTVIVTDGNTYAGTYWNITAANPITLGTRLMTWARALANSIATLSFLQAGVGAVPRGAQDKMRDVVHVADFGAVGDGVTNDYAAILKAVTAVIALGGGKVMFAAGTYYIGGNSLPMPSQVHYEGAGYVLNTSFVPAGGTIIKGNGTAPIFTDGKADGGAVYGSYAAYIADITTLGGGISKMALSTGTYGIKCGALYRPGVWYYKVDCIAIDAMSAWQIWAENNSLSAFRDIYGNNTNVNATGMFFFGVSSGAPYNNSNSHFENITCQNQQLYQRGIVFSCRAANTAQNDVFAADIQINSVRLSVTGVGTPAGGGSANIAVVNSALWPVDLPVTVTATSNGVQQWQTYFVKTSAGNVITLSDTIGGAALTFPAVTALSLVSYGFPHIELANSFLNSDPTNSFIQPFTMTGVDAEGGATTSVLLQSATGYLQLGTSNGTSQGVNVASTFCFRSAVVHLVCEAFAIFDFDITSALNSHCSVSVEDTGGVIPYVNSGFYRPVGFIRPHSRSFWFMNLNYKGVNNTTSDGIFVVAGNSGGANFLLPTNTMGERTVALNTLVLNMSGNNDGCVSYIGNANGAWTLPLLAGPVGTNSSLGQRFEICNASRTGGVTLTVNANVGQCFNNQVAKTSYSMAQGQSISVVGQTDGANFYWQVIAINGAT